MDLNPLTGDHQCVRTGRNCGDHELAIIINGGHSRLPAFAQQLGSHSPGSLILRQRKYLSVEVKALIRSLQGVDPDIHLFGPKNPLLGSFLKGLGTQSGSRKVRPDPG